MKKSSIIEKGGTIIRVGIMAIVMATIVVSFYYMVSKNLGSTEEVQLEPLSDFEKCLTQDFDRFYPESPREVMKWYNRITQLYYSGELSNKDIESLAKQMQKMMDKDLLARNPIGNYTASVKQDIAAYRDAKRKIVTTDITNTEVRQGGDYAYVTCRFFIQEASTFSNTYQTFCLRRDGGGKYKVLAFKLTDDKGNDLED